MTNIHSPDVGANPHLRVKISQAVRVVTHAIKAKLVPMIHGSPAI